MAYIFGEVEICVGGDWLEVIHVDSLLLRHIDLYGCLFGVDNDAGFQPLFPDRGLPEDCSPRIKEALARYSAADLHATWVLFSELARVNWSEKAIRRDARTTEFELDGHGDEKIVTKWLNKPGMEWVVTQLDANPESELRAGNRIYRRLQLRRADSLTDTDFPLLMDMMKLLAARFGEHRVRMVVWFE